MADQGSSQDRNLPASQRRLKKAREEGQVARSRDLGHFIAIGTCGAMLMAFAPMAWDWIQQTLVLGLRFDAATLRAPGMMGARLGEMTWRLLAVVLPFGGVMMAAAIVGCLLIGGWNWTLQPLMPQFGKLNPLPGVMNMISKDKLIDTAKGSLLALVLGAIGALFLKAHVQEFTAAMGMSLPAAIHSLSASMLGGLTLLLIAVAGVAALDVPLQLFQHAQKLKMSHAELKQEHKELEGNQEIKAKLRARMREMTRKRMLAAVPKADLVVMNPTHYAVALQYDDQKMAAPRVVAKGADLLALKIRDLARESKVPVLEAPPLARALYAHAELDQEIPAKLFGAVAQVLAYVYQLRAALSGQAAMPGNLPDLNVPKELDPHEKPVPTMEIYD